MKIECTQAIRSVCTQHFCGLCALIVEDSALNTVEDCVHSSLLFEAEHVHSVEDCVYSAFKDCVHSCLGRIECTKILSMCC